MIDILLQKGPKRDLLVQKGPRDSSIEGFLQNYSLEFYQMEKHVIENGWYIQKSLIEYFVFVANY